MVETRKKQVQELAESGLEPPNCFLRGDPNRPIGASLTPAPAAVPVIDLRRLAGPDDQDEAAKLKAALESWGLFQVIGHEMSASFMDDVRNVSRAFFQLPTEEKQKYSNIVNGEFRYEGYGNDRVVTEEQILDWNDRLYLLAQPEDERKLEIWPEKPSSFRNVLHEFTMRTRALLDLVTEAMARSLGLDQNSFTSQFEDRATLYARFNYYPCCPRPDLVFGLKPHTDGSALTVVLPDKDVDGLEVMKGSVWLKVATIPDALLVTMGDQMEIMTNGIFRSPMHRVVTNPEKDRISIAMFYAVGPEKEIEPMDRLLSEERPRLFRKVKIKDYLEVFFERLLQGERAIDWAKI